MTEGIVIPPSSSFDAALQRLVATSKKSAVTVMRQQAKLLFVEVAKITPPAGGAKGNTLSGREAEKAGKLAIVRDLHGIYGLPGRAFSDIQDRDQQAANAFWGAYKEGRMPAAAKIVKSTLGKSFVPFDGGKAGRGAAHKKQKRNAPLFYISNPASLSFHIQELQQHVWYLASGWSEALRELGAAIPYGVGKGSGPGALHVEITDSRIEIRMTNEVGYARQIKNLPAQIAFAMKVRTGSLDRQWADWMKRLARSSGFKTT